ncbi:MAG: GTPase Era [Lentimicrobiaceae bacterium]|nr:GTPase Era [Lentimicrobiaceae bacterium]
MNHKAGFISILGSPNVGKSTLMNALVGEKLSIITSKAQTTRHRIMGIVNGDDFQIVYSDTPGIITPHYLLHKAMMKFIDKAMEDSDLFLLVTEMHEDFPHQDFLEKLKSLSIPVIVLINKIDLSDPAGVEKKFTEWHEKLPQADIIPVSALYKANLEKVLEIILEKLPENPPFFPKDELTDRSMRFFVSEMIREKILLLYKKEIPYCTEIAIDSFKEEEKITRISATIFVARDSQKPILIGHQGNAIKKLGTEARKEIEAFLEKHIFLELSVKVNKDWRDSERELKRFGYES